jgi:hypothetical protein
MKDSPRRRLPNKKRCRLKQCRLVWQLKAAPRRLKKAAGKLPKNQQSFQLLPRLPNHWQPWSMRSPYIYLIMKANWPVTSRPTLNWIHPR